MAAPSGAVGLARSLHVHHLAPGAASSLSRLAGLPPPPAPAPPAPMSDEEKPPADNRSSSSTEGGTTESGGSGTGESGGTGETGPTDVAALSDVAEESRPSELRLGRCKWFNVLKGFGFIVPDDGGAEVFVHQSVLRMPGFRSLDEGEAVEFAAAETERGWEASFVAGHQTDLRGSRVRPIGKKKHKKIRCFNCGQYGSHIAAKCVQGPQPKSCYHCHSTDHLVSQCPSRPNDRARLPDSAPLPNGVPIVLPNGAPLPVPISMPTTLPNGIPNGLPNINASAQLNAQLSAQLMQASGPNPIPSN